MHRDRALTQGSAPSNRSVLVSACYRQRACYRPKAVAAAARRVVRVLAVTNCGGFEFPALQSVAIPAGIAGSLAALRKSRVGACAVLRNEFPDFNHFRQNFSRMIQCCCGQMAACVLATANLQGSSHGSLGPGLATLWCGAYKGVAGTLEGC
jgi:hypothetical protein